MVSFITSHNAIFFGLNCPCYSFWTIRYTPNPRIGENKMFRDFPFRSQILGNLVDFPEFIQLRWLNWIFFVSSVVWVAGTLPRSSWARPYDIRKKRTGISISSTHMVSKPTRTQNMGTSDRRCGICLWIVKTRPRFYGIRFCWNEPTIMGVFEHVVPKMAMLFPWWLNPLELGVLQWQNDIWLLVWNSSLFFHMLGIITPTDELIFQRGWNHQPDI